MVSGTALRSWAASSLCSSNQLCSFPEGIVVCTLTSSDTMTWIFHQFTEVGRDVKAQWTLTHFCTALKPFKCVLPFRRTYSQHRSRLQWQTAVVILHFIYEYLIRIAFWRRKGSVIVNIITPLCCYPHQRILLTFSSINLVFWPSVMSLRVKEEIVGWQKSQKNSFHVASKMFLM